MGVKMVGNARPSIQIDLNEFKLHLHLKGRPQLTFYFNSPSRSFYLSVIALVVNEMKRLGRVKSISLQEHLDLLTLLNESIGGAAGSSDKESLLPRIYRKWKNALPNLEEAPLFKVLGKKKEEEDEAIGKVYPFTDAEKDGWANLFDYVGSEENVRLKFAIDKIGVGLNEISIIFGDSRDGEAWDQFIASLKKEKKEEKEESVPAGETAAPEPPAVPFSPPQERKISWLYQYRWALLVVVVGIVAGMIWKIFLGPAPTEVASVERMKYPLPDKPSIAVLPFANLSKDPDQEYFIEGMIDDLITDLSKISGVFVIARTSSSTYKAKDVKVKQVAEELGVRYVLEGSVRREDDEIRINAQLVDAMTGHHLWAERYDGTMGKIFVLQDRITQKIVTALAVKLTGSEKELVGKKGTENVAAYDFFLRGWGHYLRLTPEDFAKAAASFKKAIELDPNYGRAYAALSAVYWDAALMPVLLKGLGVSWFEARARTFQCLEKATEGPISHSVKSQRYLWRRQHQEAILEAEQGLALDPSDPTSLYHMGIALTYAGSPKEALEIFKKGLRLDPHNPSRYLAGLGRAHFCMGELIEAVGLYEKAMRLNPETAPSAWGCCRAAFYALVGRDQEARSMFETLKKQRSEVSVPGPLNLRAVMNSAPYKDRAVAERLVEGLLKAGFPPANIRGGYFPAFKENQLTGGEIKNLLFGSAIAAYIFYPQQFSMKFKKNGEFTYEGPSITSTFGGPTSDTGKSRIEGDTICWQYEKNFGGVEFCGTVFRYPGGTYERKDEYFWCSDFGFSTFSVVR
jgi:TolB-like protein/Flp pilus assembly protein TadD